MIIYLSNGKQIRGDLIKSAVLRSDMSPVPVTLEAEIRTDDDFSKFLTEGQLLAVGGESGDALRIIKSNRVINRVVQGDREMSAIQITAILDSCHHIVFVRSRAIIKENSTLSVIYRAAGANIKAIDADFPVPRFYCPIGDTPSFHITRALQEEGGVVRWKNGRLRFFRLPDLFKQKEAMTLPNNASDDVDSGFLKRHEIPWFYSLDESGAVVLGNQQKPRSVRFSPFKNVQRLRNMSRCLVQSKISKINLNPRLAAGDLINFVDGVPLCIITAAHVFENDTDGSGSNQYTRLWLGSLEE
ncbi:MAG: hypothetical protein K2Q13_10095 [Nitrosomonas sp.]|uniref:hypothetical protein n=1 Tax=Nitrosomonas sp. TaxID=42353 RepID=UPI0025FBD146|nr:hypothetical protein [Nitrosomonas sp.]MBY0475392.1 hypothetical protein [Nitrosomonas sp.]